MEWLAIWFGLSLLIGVSASVRHRSGLGWFVLSLLFSPLLMGLLLAVLPRRDGGLAGYDTRTHRQCPECMETVRIDARRCKHCGSAITPITPPPC